MWRNYLRNAIFINMKKLLTIIATLLATLSVNAQYGEYVGGDISVLPLYEEHNSGYLDGSGQKIDDLITWFVQDCGWNTFRVRLFVNPQKKNVKGETDSCVCQDLDYVKKLGKRIKDAGAKFVVDLHYSDTWADPSYQLLPSAWSDCTTSALKAERVYSYTKETMQALKDAGAEPDFVQVGNETTYGMVGIKVWPYENASSDWAGLTAVMGKGCDAVHEVCPNAKVIIHTERSGNDTQTNYYYNKLKAAGVNYDIIGLSYYPFYHGYLSALASTLNNLAANFPDKKVQIVETSYFFQYFPSSTDVKYQTNTTWPATANGQYAFMKDLIAELAKHSNVNGLYYWQPEEAGCGDDSNWDTTGATVMSSWLNRGLWWCDTKTNGHWPVMASEGMVSYLMKDFLGSLKGDVNGDGFVNISDVNAIICVMCGTTTYDKADVNGDGVVNISDVNAVIAIMCGA